jgi:hypothetical protein
MATTACTLPQIPASSYSQFGWFTKTLLRSELLNLRQDSELKGILPVTSDRTRGHNGRIYFRSCVSWAPI